MANGRLSFDLMDYSRETSGFSVNTGAVTAVSLPGLLTQIGTLRTALGNIVLGTITQEALSAFVTRLSNTPPASDLAQIEEGWYVQYEDVTQFFDDPVNAIPNAGFGKLFGFTIPTPDVTGKLIANTDDANLADTDIAAFVTAFEALARSPYGGAVNVTKITLVGRNR